MFLYSQPNKTLFLNRFKPGLSFARGGIVLNEKYEQGIPNALEFFRFDIVLVTTDKQVTASRYRLHKLINMEDDCIETTWSEECEAGEKLEEDLRKREECDVEDYLEGLNIWRVMVDDSYSNLKTDRDLKASFSQSFEDEFVVRHFFETKWMIQFDTGWRGIDFTDVYKH